MHDNDVKLLSDDEINAAPYYKRMRVSDGVRTIWFPVDESRFEFREPHAVIDTAQNPEGTHPSNVTIFPTRYLQADNGYPYPADGTVVLPGEAHPETNAGNAGSNKRYAQHNDGLRPGS